MQLREPPANALSTHGPGRGGGNWCGEDALSRLLRVMMEVQFIVRFAGVETVAGPCLVAALACRLALPWARAHGHGALHGHAARTA
jgi:hypothetical protein